MVPTYRSYWNPTASMKKRVSCEPHPSHSTSLHPRPPSRHPLTESASVYAPRSMTACRLSTSSVHRRVVVQREDVHMDIARGGKWPIHGRAREEQACHRGQLEEHAVVLGQREVHHRDMRRPLETTEPQSCRCRSRRSLEGVVTMYACGERKEKSQTHSGLSFA